jgi:polysaccharide biosynthesis transport protein
MELKTYFLPLIKWWWLVLAATVVAGTSAYLTVRNEPELFQSRTTLIVGQALTDPNPSTAQLSVGMQLAGAYADIAMREPVRGATMEALGLSFLPAYNVRALPQGNIVEITVIDTNPERAQQVAQELATQLVLLSAGRQAPGELERQAFLSEQLDKLQVQITETEEEITVRQSELGELFSAREIEGARTDIAALQQKLTTLQSNYAALLSNTRENAINTLAVLEPASFSRRPIGTERVKTIAIASAVGMALALGAAYLLEYLDDTIKTPKEVSKRFGLPVVGTIARLHQGDGGSSLIMLEAPRSPEAEGFRGLRTAIQFVLDSDNAESILLTSPHQTEGKSLVAANLALAMAQAGQRTLLIDADLHRPTQHKLFNVDNTHGLSTVLCQRELFEQVEPEALPLPEFLTNDFITGNTGEKKLSVMTSGPIQPNAAELLVKGAVRKLLDLVAKEYDVVIVDTPPVLALSDAATLSSQVDFVFVLARAERTRRADLQNALDHLEGVGAAVGGIILNELSPTSEHYYYSYQRYSDYGRQDRSSERADQSTSSRSNGLMAGPRESIRRLRNATGKTIDS